MKIKQFSQKSDPSEITAVKIKHGTTAVTPAS